MSNPDIIVIGAGLSGLCTALTLAQQNKHVFLIEQLDRFGGLCGQHDVNGHSYTIACNDFGNGMINSLKRLGVKTQFEKKKSRVFYEGETIDTPIDFMFLLKLMKSPQQFAALLKGIWQYRRTSPPLVTISDFTNAYLKPGRIKDIVEIPAYLMGTSPADFNLKYLAYETEYKYGYNNPGVPVGGPNQLISDLVAACWDHGVTLLKNTKVTEVKEKGAHIEVTMNTAQKVSTISASKVIDTRPHTKAYPPDTKQGMMLCQLRLLAKNHTFDSRYHTYLHYPKDGGNAMDKLDKGQWCTQFPFHFFPNSTSDNEYTAINVFFYQPRGITHLDEAKQQQLLDYILTCIDKMLPKLSDSIVEHHFFDAQSFFDEFHQWPQVMPFIWHGNKPSNQTGSQHIFRGGHTAYPPGDHAGAAVLSAEIVSNLVMKETP